jgi:hypothetical protein
VRRQVADHRAARSAASANHLEHTQARVPCVPGEDGSRRRLELLHVVVAAFARQHTVTSFAESQMMTNALAGMPEEVKAATPMALQSAKATDLMGTRELENLQASLIWSDSERSSEQIGLTHS